MANHSPIKIDERIHLIDGFDLGMPNRTGVYVINEEDLTIVESGPSPSIRYIKQGLKELGFLLEQVKYIIVTHIHLDHAGGVGLLLEDCPNATVVVHARGAWHLANPDKLIKGARTVYGEKFDQLFDPIIPVPENRLIVKGEGDKLRIGSECSLEFFDTPGHANHHFSIYDPISNGMFTGDTVGIRYQLINEVGMDLFLPTTSPNQFNPTAMRDSIDRILKMHLDRIYFGHFGMTKLTNDALEKVANWVNIFVEEGKQVAQEQKGYEVLSERLLTRIKSYLRKKHIQDNHPIYTILALDMEVSAMGIMDYLQKS